jgi:hypothetical protein
MKGMVVGEAGEGGINGQVVVRAIDYTGRGLAGLKWNVSAPPAAERAPLACSRRRVMRDHPCLAWDAGNVRPAVALSPALLLRQITLLDADNTVLDAVRSASTAFGLAEDMELSSSGPRCSARAATLDCAGLYGFGDRLAIANWVKTGFYRFRFEVQGFEVVQEQDVYMKNQYLPDVLFLELYMVASLATVLLSFSILQISKEPPKHFSPTTAQYTEARSWGFLLSFPIMCLVGLMAYVNWLFYDTSEKTKLPPHLPDGFLLLSDYISKWMVVLVPFLLCPLACTIKTLLMTRV